MLSRTTTASSMSRPMASESPSSVSWLSEKPSTYMTKSVPTTEVGSASARDEGAAQVEQEERG